MKDNKERETKDRSFDDYSKSTFFKCIVIILLIIIIILLLLNSCGNVAITNHGEYTGAFDIYEITLKGTCECPICETCVKCEEGSEATPGGNKKPSEEASGEYTPTEEDTGLIVYDKEDKWTEDSTSAPYVPSIFKHSSYEIIDGKIAPGSQNAYKFVVRNLNNFTVKYTITAIEINTKNINMKYRLRNENNYLIGSASQWVDAESIATSFKSLSGMAMDTYYLDWKWFDDDINDTPIGIDETSTYSLSLKVEAEEG